MLMELLHSTNFIVCPLGSPHTCTSIVCFPGVCLSSVVNAVHIGISNCIDVWNRVCLLNDSVGLNPDWRDLLNGTLISLAIASCSDYIDDRVFTLTCLPGSLIRTPPEALPR